MDGGEIEVHPAAVASLRAQQLHARQLTNYRGERAAHLDRHSTLAISSAERRNKFYATTQVYARDCELSYSQAVRILAGVMPAAEHLSTEQAEALTAEEHVLEAWPPSELSFMNFQTALVQRGHVRTPNSYTKFMTQLIRVVHRALLERRGAEAAARADVRLLYPDRHKDFIAVMSRHQDYSVHRVPSLAPYQLRAAFQQQHLQCTLDLAASSCAGHFVRFARRRTTVASLQTQEIALTVTMGSTPDQHVPGIVGKASSEKVNDLHGNRIFSHDQVGDRNAADNQNVDAAWLLLSACSAAGIIEAADLGTLPLGSKVPMVLEGYQEGMYVFHFCDGVRRVRTLPCSTWQLNAMLQHFAQRGGLPSCSARVLRRALATNALGEVLLTPERRAEIQSQVKLITRTGGWSSAPAGQQMVQEIYQDTVMDLHRPLGLLAGLRHWLLGTQHTISFSDV